MEKRKRIWPNRKSIRLEGWDYSNPGLYFVTICTEKREPYLGDVKNGIMGLSIPGSVAHYYWSKIKEQFRTVEIDEYIVMPNHIHGIIGITGRDTIHGVRQDHDADQGSDAMNRVPTDEDHATEPVGSPVHRDPEHNTKGGATGQHNPMLYKTHLGKIIRWYKGRCTFEIRKRNYSDFAWQSRFYDHIIRNEQSLSRIRKYIFNNPLRWQIDRENPNSNEVHERAVEYMAAME